MVDSQADDGHADEQASLEEQLANNGTPEQTTDEGSEDLARETAPLESEEGESASADSVTVADEDEEQSVDTAAGKSVDWEARFKGLQRRYNKDIQERKSTGDDSAALQQRLAQLEEQLANRRRQEEEAAVPAWNPKSPRHNDFKTKYELVKQFRAQWHRAAPEEREIVTNMWGSTLTEADMAEAAQYDNWIAERNRRYAEDPFGAIRNEVSSEVGRILQEREASMARQQRYMQMTHVEYKDTVEKHRDELASMVQQGYLLEEILPQFKLKDDLAALQAQLSGSEKAKAQAKEQQRLMSGDAEDVVATSPKAAGGGKKTAQQIYAEAVKVAKAEGIDPHGSPGPFYKILDRIESKYS